MGRRAIREHLVEKWFGTSRVYQFFEARARSSGWMIGRHILGPGLEAPGKT